MASVGSGDQNHIALNVIPLLDIFSILILFLLMSFSADPVSHDLLESIVLPDSATTVSLDEVPTIKISKTDMYVNDRKIVEVVGGDVPEKDRTQGEIRPLFDELDKLAEANKRLNQRKNQTGTLTVECDKTIPFKLLKRVMLSAQQADFVTFKYMNAKLQR